MFKKSAKGVPFYDRWRVMLSAPTFSVLTLADTCMHVCVCGHVWVCEISEEEGAEKDINGKSYIISNHSGNRVATMATFSSSAWPPSYYPTLRLGSFHVQGESSTLARIRLLNDQRVESSNPTSSDFLCPWTRHLMSRRNWFFWRKYRFASRPACAFP